MNTVAKGLRSQSAELELELGLGFEPKLKLAEVIEADSGTVTGSLTRRVDAIDWFNVEEELNGYGCAMLPNLLSAQECDALSALYPRDDLYRSRVVMGRHGFGRGEYKYFAYPLPQPVAALREALYPRLAPVANRWNEVMKIDVRYPAAHGDFVERCHAAGQLRPTPLILQYAKGDAVVFAVHHRPVQGSRGVYRVNLRHGVSRLRSGHRHTLGVIFHDAA